MPYDRDCESCNPIALRAERDEWWSGFRRHAIVAQPDIDKTAIDKAIADFRAAQGALTAAIKRNP